MKIAIQGFEGSYHAIAAQELFPDEEIELVCCATFPDLFRALQSSPSTLGLMAIENTIAGSLLPNYEMLRSSGARILAEHKLRIKHSLVCLPSDSFATLREVHSHPVALAQCRGYLEGLRLKDEGLRIVEADDTAGAAARIAEARLQGHAAICHSSVAKMYGLRVLEEGIEDNKHNYTRFLLIAHCTLHNAQCTMHNKTGGKGTAEAFPYKTSPGSLKKSSIVFSLPHEEGSLSHILSILSFYHVNLTKIQSLPIIGREWEYLFYVDLTYTDDVRYQQSIAAVRPLLKELTILGEYEAR